jgi:hypothetical protein
MLRAEKCFRKQGLNATPAPCLFRDIQFTAEDLLPSWPEIDRRSWNYVVPNPRVDLKRRRLYRPVNSTRDWLPDSCIDPLSRVGHLGILTS